MATVRTDENSPLLPPGDSDAPLRNGSAAAGDGDKPAGRLARFATPEVRLLFANFLLSTSFCFTQVPLLYTFRIMACDAFYARTPPGPADSNLPPGMGDRCSRPEVDAQTTLQMTLMGLSTVFCGMFNLAVTRRVMARYGPRRALVLNAFFPVLRVLVQMFALQHVGGAAGLVVMQASQLFGVVGSPAGIVMAVNTAVAEVVRPAERTAAFGRLQGSSMFGMALGFLVGGVAGNVSIALPFQLAAVCLALCCPYAAVFAPYIDPKSMQASAASTKPKKSSSSLLAVMGPQKLRLADGRAVRHYGVPILVAGIYVSVLATGNAPFLIQQYAIIAFAFAPAENSLLIAGSSLIRGVFLMFIFPAVIAAGRRWFAASGSGSGGSPRVTKPTMEPGIPTNAADLDPGNGVEPAHEPGPAPAPVEQEEGARFDLFFLRWSLLLDAIITGSVAFATQGWHIYLAGALLPFASGSAAASKGVLTDMCPASRRSDAIQAMAVVEYVSVMSTMAVFGLVFSAFAAAGRAYMTFYCNAAIALVAIAILLFSRFPPADSRLVDDDEEEEHEEGDVASGTA